VYIRLFTTCKEPRIWWWTTDGARSR